MWTEDIPTEAGWYLWRFSPPNEPPTLEPFLIYEAFGTWRVQEFGGWRESARGAWDLSEWAYRAANDGEYTYPTEYLYLGPPETNVQLIRAFRELYHSAVSAHRDLCWTPDLSDNGRAVMVELMAAINEIHKENK